MNKFLLHTLLILSLLLSACEDCEIISTETEPATPLVDCPELGLNIGDPCDDDNPATIGDTVNENCICIGSLEVDCPALGLNIGDACDDGNPDTANDTVDANCECVGEPVNTCEGAILVMRAQVEDNGLGNLFLDRADLAPLDVLNFTQLTPVNGDAILLGEAVPFQFSTVNPDQQQYLYSFQYSTSGVNNPLLVASADGSAAPSYLLSELPYAAPVYHSGEMFAIDVAFDEPNLMYTILNVDLVTGQPTGVFSGSVTVNSQVVNPVFFSASNGSNKVFFLAGTSLFEYDVNLNALTHVLLVAEPDPDMTVVYTGLEYRSSTNQLLALRHQASGADIQTSLVTISQDGTFTQNELLSITGYTFFQDAGVLHATAYNSCEDKYYITTPRALEPENFESYLIEVNLPTATLTDRIWSGFLFGVSILEE